MKFDKWVWVYECSYLFLSIVVYNCFDVVYWGGPLLKMCFYPPIKTLFVVVYTVLYWFYYAIYVFSFCDDLLYPYATKAFLGWSSICISRRGCCTGYGLYDRLHKWSFLDPIAHLGPKHAFFRASSCNLVGL